MSKNFFVHESSYVDTTAKIGSGTKIWHFCNVMKNAVLGKDCVLGQNVHVGPNVKIGNQVKIQNNVSIYEGVTLEDGVFCGPSMVFTNVMNPRSFISRKNEFKNTLVKKGATIGANATIVCGHTLGEFSFIGAGAVVTKDVLSHALMLGNPARQSGWMCSCGVKLPDSLKCACGAKFRQTKSGLEPLST
jgi:UDP-2-acetamido-3-amino-2,3-dideoxy-glucuronate N-acetyltransferase